MLQETHSTEKWAKRWRTEWGGKAWFAHGTSNSEGTAILCQRNFNFEIKDAIKDPEGRFILARGRLSGEKILLASVYGPNIDDPEFYQNLFNKIDETGISHKIIGGDFNLVRDQSLDRTSGYHKNVQAAQVLNQSIEQLNLIDIWRELKTAPGYTWRRVHPYLLAECLDMIFIDQSMVQFVNQVNISHGYRSDHKIVDITLQYNINPRGPGYWKLNTSLLKDNDYVQKINQLLNIELAQESNYSSKRTHWEIIKLTVRSSTLQFAARKAKSRANKIEALQRKITYWQNEGSITLFPKVEKRIADLTNELNKLQVQRTEGAILRSKADFAELGEKPTKYYYNLEKSRFNKKTIQRLKVDNQYITNDKQIGEALTRYYKNLYTSNHTVDKIYLQSLDTPKLPDQQRKELDKDITQLEVAQAIRDLPNNKVGGTDGLPIQFYKMFYPKLKNFLYELLVEIIKEGQLHLSARQGIISLLEKTGKDPLLIENWRPISLLCSDYKIFAKIIAKRLQATLQDLLHYSQTGFLKHRNIAENIMKLQSVYHYCESEQKSAVLLSFDFKKAFDIVSWEAIVLTFQHFNFGHNFINMIKILYNNISSCVFNNGYWTQHFLLQKSTRQGCPASSLIFNTVVKLLGHKI